MAQHYSPYPTLVDLRRAGPLAGFGADPAPSVSIEADARALGLKLAARPQGPARVQAAWEVLASVDIITVRLEKSYRTLVGLLGRVGGALCTELNLYNQTALDLEQVQRSALGALRVAGVKGLPADPPYPALFVGYGVNASPAGGAEIACAGGDIVVAAGPDGAAGVRIRMRQPCATGPELGALGVAPIVVVVVGLAFVATMVAEWRWAEAWQDVERFRENTAKGRANAAFLEARLDKVRALTEKCIAGGGNAIACLRNADATTPKSIDAFKPDLATRTRGIIWWLGAGTLVAGATWGVIAYRRHKAR